MFLPAKMTNLTAIIYDTDVEKVTAAILRSGMLQLADATEVREWAKDMTPVDNEEMVEKYFRLEERIKSISAKLGKPIGIGIEDVADKDLDFNAIAAELDGIDEEADGHIAKKREARQEIGRLMSLLSEARTTLSKGLPLDVNGPFSFLDARAVRVSGKNVPVLNSLLKSIPSVVLQIGTQGDKVDCLVMVLRKDRRVLDDALNEISYARIELPEQPKEEIDESFAGEIREKIQKEERELDEANTRLAKIADKKMVRLSELLSLVHTRKVVHLAQNHFKKTARTYLISGWIPSSDSRELAAHVKSVTGGRCFIEETTAEDLGAAVDVPVKFENPAFLRPFELISGEYGLPRYNTIDPTPFVAVSFIAMFGAMFGDVGHGAILALLGFLIFRKTSSDESRRVGGLLMYAGIAAIAFGFLYGSLFGASHYSRLLPYEGYEPVSYAGTAFKIAIYFGIGLMTLGIILNIINSVLTGQYFGGVFSKEGLIGGAMYWIGIVLVSRLAVTGEIGMRWSTALILVLSPILLFYLRAPIRKIFRPQEPMFEDGALGYVMESGIELLEIFLGYFANTMSFIRVAAFAIGHGVLLMTVYIVASTLGRWGIIIHILGNAGIIVLEGIIVTIQAVRLEYYEFFGKFFHTGKRGFKPSNLTEVQ
jgi:V/A-type H+-transporting ATPase subunit I